MKRRLTCAVLALCLLLSGCAATGTTSPQRYSVTWWDVFDTVTVISGYADSEADWNTQMTALHADLLRYNQLYDIYNHYDGMTNLADVNAGAAAAPVAVGDEIMNLLTFAQEMYQATDGACNAAAGAVLRYWHDARTAAGDGAEVSADILPKTADLQAAAAHCNMDDLILNQNTGTVYFADPELQLDVGSIGKGYAVEQCAQAAEARGLTSALLNVGGNVRAIGTKPNSGPCVRYHHLIDLTTLQPARYMNSVAIVSSDSGLGDALSTGVFCMPVEKGQALIEQLNDVEALWMLSDETMVQSSGWGK